MKKSLIKKMQSIKVVLTDVDGVLTDGGMYYSKDGDVMKKFFTRDGMGVTLLRKIGVPTIIVTKEKNAIIKQWSKKMKIEKLYDGVLNKELILPKIKNQFKVNASEVAYIGDDVNDLGLLKLVGLSATPNDAILEAKKISFYQCVQNGGHGAFRELVDQIILAKTIKTN
ncbi:3-deoxy-D-manno-octulosonate 8-phosphate phosphatase KdsC protein [Marine Group I thaumarchaeote SCGC AAA799-E16]|uniref:3-deoxy-D-manno-octulosonate 8-phosphate phosphatase KdsC protein n=2 Tax=Marine Group I TaxID=905826 RepID=A0A087S261_9ARCH|nr:3-deoxy-D-manno-octulosonate 8-phosphate phosphatase KdsC protein [Marine Group I thaumarchaeote SCGC AAA799-E16]KFM19815.1 3-deoxy-D-manno-octulosonate 8-phosphate phosphatase KdsC protein [Marine Group I thaumarchaeote SCGC RSA3]